MFIREIWLLRAFRKVDFLKRTFFFSCLFVSNPLQIALPDGTEFTIVATEEITSKTASEGDLLTFSIAEEVLINRHVVIAKDALVKGKVATAKKSGFFGRERCSASPKLTTNSLVTSSPKARRPATLQSVPDHLWRPAQRFRREFEM